MDLMILFWACAAALTALCSLIVMTFAARPVVSDDRDQRLAAQSKVVAQIDRMLALGQIDAAAHAQTRAEAGRELLRAARTADAASLPGGRRSLMFGLVASLLIATGIYLGVGKPGAPDQPLAARLDDWASRPAELDAPRLAAVMDAIVVQRPGDATALRNLGLARLAAGQAPQAAAALRQAIELRPRDAGLWSLLGEALLDESQGGYTSEVRRVFATAAELDPKATAPRYYLARARLAQGDRAGGLAALTALERDLPAEDPRKRGLAGEISRLAAGSPAAVGPAAAAAMDPAVLPQIEAMVGRLAARLEADPDDAAGWVRLVRSYTVLGRLAERDAALRQARQRFAADRSVLDQLDAAAQEQSR